MTDKDDWLSRAFREAEREGRELPDWARPVRVPPAGEPDYPVPPTRAGRWFFIQCERHGWLYYLTLPYWMARCAWLRRRAP